MPWARASALHRHIDCPGASWLPRLDRGIWKPGYLAEGVFVSPPLPTEKDDTTAADWGTAMHAAKALAPEACDPWLSAVDPYRDEEYPPHLGVHEQSVAYDCRTRRVFLGPTNVSAEEAGAWKDSQGPDCITGTCDWWATLPTGIPWVDDLKTGWRTPEVVTPQTLFYLLLRCRVAKANEGYISITHWPQRAERPTREGLWRHVTYVALDAFEDEVCAAWVKATRGPEVRPGPSCQYCPSARVCDKAFQ